MLSNARHHQGVTKLTLGIIIASAISWARFIRLKMSPSDGPLGSLRDHLTSTALRSGQGDGSCLTAFSVYRLLLQIAGEKSPRMKMRDDLTTRLPSGPS